MPRVGYYIARWWEVCLIIFTILVILEMNTIGGCSFKYRSNKLWITAFILWPDEFCEKFICFKSPWCLVLSVSLSICRVTKSTMRASWTWIPSYGRSPWTAACYMEATTLSSHSSSSNPNEVNKRGNKWCLFDTMAPFYLYGLTWIPAWISNHMRSKVCGKG